MKISLNIIYSIEIFPQNPREFKLYSSNKLHFHNKFMHHQLILDIGCTHVRILYILKDNEV